MSPLSICKTLPLLILLTLPTAIFSTPTPAPQDPCQPRGPPGPPGTPGNPPSGCSQQAPQQQNTDTTQEILPRYQILFAQVSSSRVEIGNTTLTDSKMNITVSGTQPGNVPVKCFGEWMFDSAVEKLTFAQLPCEDPNVEVGLNQVREEHPGIEIAVGVFVKGQDGYRARWATRTDNSTDWACTGAVGVLGSCALVLPVVIDSPSANGPQVPAA